MNRSVLQIVGISALTSLVVSTVVCVVLLNRPFARRSARWSRKAPGRLVAVPPLKGLLLLKARGLALRSGLRLSLSQQKHSPSKEGTILLQYPTAGSSVRKGEAIEVIVSLGPRPGSGSIASKNTPSPAATGSPTATPPSGGTRNTASGDSKVPYVKRMKLVNARARIRRAGLVVGRISYRVDNDKPPTWVLSQFPVWGTSVKRGSRVDLVVNKDEDD